VEVFIPEAPFARVLGGEGLACAVALNLGEASLAVTVANRIVTSARLFTGLADELRFAVQQLG
jgi:hypothetical protein